MDVQPHLLNGLLIALSPANLGSAFVGCFVGMLIGVLPGIGSAGGMIIPRPFALKVDPTGAIVMLAANLYGGYDGGTTLGDPHAWIEVDLPGAGAIAFDPTKRLAGSDRLIRVAVSRDAEQAISVRGS